MFACLECGRLFKTARAAERAFDQGCPRCGVDIDLATLKPGRSSPRRYPNPARPTPPNARKE